VESYSSWSGSLTGRYGKTRVFRTHSLRSMAGLSGVSCSDIPMKCAICHDGETHPGIMTVTLERSGVTLVIKNVPAEVSDVCGEKNLAEKTVKELREELEAAEAQGAEVQVRSYAA
jgi:YgiT-type zinc finger domain-containing protein